MAQQNPPDVWAFLKEFIKRLGQKSPKFFVILGNISLLATLITGLPIILEDLGITLPDAWQAIANKAIAYAGVWGKIVSMLAVQRSADPAAPEKLPFTAKKESDPDANTTPSKGL